MALVDEATPMASLGDMPTEVVASVLSWLPPPAVGACLAASRTFWVLTESDLARHALLRTVHGATGACPCSVLVHDNNNNNNKQPRQAKVRRDMVRSRQPPPGHARTCLPDAMTAAAASGRLDLVQALYTHAALLWFGDVRCACCVNPRGAAIDYVATEPPHSPCPPCSDFLDWIFYRDARCNHLDDPFMLALSGGRARTAAWIIAAGGLHHTEPRSASYRATRTDDDDDDKGQEDDGCDADERLLARLWSRWPDAAARSMCCAARSADINALDRAARVWCRASRGDQRRLSMSGTEALVEAAAASPQTDDTLRTVWRDFATVFADRPNTYRHVAKVAALAGCMDVALEAACAFRQCAAAVLCARVAGGRAAAHRFRPLGDVDVDDNKDGLVDNADGHNILMDDQHDNQATVCSLVACAVRSGRADAIDVALALWRRCRLCAKRGGFGCDKFGWDREQELRTPDLRAGLVHVVAHFPDVWPTRFALEAVICAGRVDLLDRLRTPSHTSHKTLGRLIESTARDGHTDAVRYLLQRYDFRYGIGVVLGSDGDLTPAVMAAVSAGHLDTLRLLWAHVSEGKAERATAMVADAAIKGRHANIIAWIVDGRAHRPPQALWAAAAQQGDEGTLAALSAQAWRPPLFSPSAIASIAVAHGHIACASFMMGLLSAGTLFGSTTLSTAIQRTGTRAPTSSSSRPPKRRRVDKDKPLAGRQPTLAPSYVIDALSRGHVDAVDWAAAGPFRVPWADVSIATALDRAQDTGCFDAIVRWATGSPTARSSPRLSADLVAWAASTLASGDAVRIGRLLTRCPWREWGVTPANMATGMCVCPVAMWRTLDTRRGVPFDAPCFADAIAASGRVDLLVWMADERRPVDRGSGQPPLFGVDHAEAAYGAGHVGAASWILGRLNAAAVVEVIERVNGFGALRGLLVS